jgi:hypothetical protein
VGLFLAAVVGRTRQLVLSLLQAATARSRAVALPAAALTPLACPPTKASPHASVCVHPCLLPRVLLGFVCV